MVKHTIKKRIPIKNNPTEKRVVVKKKHVPIQKRTNVDKILVENFVALQKVMTNLSFKFDDLSSQISKLLELFEISAKTIAAKDMGSEEMDKGNKEVIEKLNNLIDQNKTIARGLTLMHEINPQREVVQKKIPERQVPSRILRQPLRNEMGKYQKSMASRDNDSKF